MIDGEIGLTSMLKEEGVQSFFIRLDGTNGPMLRG